MTATVPPGARVFVVGAGLMGSGIAAQCALAGFPTLLEDLNAELTARGLERARRALGRAVERGATTPAAHDAALERLATTVGFNALPSATIVIEAAPEDLGLKRQLFGQLEAIASAPAILATNTSSLPIAQIADGLRRPERLVGLHFFNPVLQMPLVELIAGTRTAPEIVEATAAFATALGKTVVRSADSPGFVTSRALAVLVNEAARMLEQGVADRDDIDAAYRLGFHHPMGPFELVDLVGIDTTVAILDILFQGLGDERYRASPLLRRMAGEGKLGRKSGEGFYSYPRPGPPTG